MVFPTFQAVVQWCAQEVHRQDAGPLHVAGMFRAWDYAWAHRAPENIDQGRISYVNELITLGQHGRYRRQPAVFTSGAHALSAELIPRQMRLLVEEAKSEGLAITPAEWTKAFLDIHPFADGNGRTAAILFNWLSGTLRTPLPLPDFYGPEDKFQ